MSTEGWSGPTEPWGPQQGPPQQQGPQQGTPPYPGTTYPYGRYGPYDPYAPVAPQGPGHPWGPPAGAGPPGTGPATGGPPPRRRGRRVVLGLLTALVVAGLVVLALLAFVVGPRFARVDVLDPVAVERGVSDVVTQDWRRTVTGVDCPSEVRVRAGVSFRCSATVDGRPRQVPVDVLDDEGTYQVGQPR